MHNFHLSRLFFYTDKSNTISLPFICYCIKNDNIQHAGIEWWEKLVNFKRDSCFTTISRENVSGKFTKRKQQFSKKPVWLARQDFYSPWALSSVDRRRHWPLISFESDLYLYEKRLSAQAYLMVPRIDSDLERCTRDASRTRHQSKSCQGLEDGENRLEQTSEKQLENWAVVSLYLEARQAKMLLLMVVASAYFKLCVL